MGTEHSLGITSTIVRLSLRGVLCTALVALSIGCSPRGETKSLSEIVRGSMERFHAASDGAPLPESVAVVLPKLSDNLKALLDKVNEGGDDEPVAEGVTAQQSDVMAEINSIIQNLRTLNASAGYTSRPAIGELINQFGAIADSSTVDPSTIALVVSRTYGILADELEGVRFQLHDRELKK